MSSVRLLLAENPIRKHYMRLRNNTGGNIEGAEVEGRKRLMYCAMDSRCALAWRKAQESREGRNRVDERDCRRL